MLVLLVLFVVAALWGAGFLTSLESEDDTIDALREAIVRDATGTSPCADTPALARWREQSPNFWFVIRDRDGHSVSQGRVPREYADIGDALDGDRPGAARLEHRGRAAPDGADEVDRYPAGNVQILTGAGGVVSWRRVALGDLDAVPGSSSCPSSR